MKYVVNLTNCKRNILEYQRDRDARQSNKAEILTVLGLLYCIGVKKGTQGSVEEVWDKQSGFGLSRQVMNYKKFLFLRWCLHFDDRSTKENSKEDKLTAILETLEVFVANCKNSYSFIIYDMILKSSYYAIQKLIIPMIWKFIAASNRKIHKKPKTHLGPRVSTLFGEAKGILTTDNWCLSFPFTNTLVKYYEITIIGTLTTK